MDYRRHIVFSHKNNGFLKCWNDSSIVLILFILPTKALLKWYWKSLLQVNFISVIHRNAYIPQSRNCFLSLVFFYRLETTVGMLSIDSQFIYSQFIYSVSNNTNNILFIYCLLSFQVYQSHLRKSIAKWFLFLHLKHVL